MSRPMHFPLTSLAASSQKLEIAFFALSNPGFINSEITLEFNFKFFSPHELPVQNHFDLFFFELSSDNLEVLQQLCQSFQDVPVIAILTEELDPIQVLALGVQDYIHADELTMPAIQRIIQKALARKHLSNPQTSCPDLKSQGTARISEHSPAMVCRWYMPDSVTVEFLYLSQNITQFGYSAEELLNGSVSWLNIIHPDDYQDTLKKYTRFVKEGVSNFSVSYRIFTRDGDLRWIEDHSSIERHSDGKVKYLQGLILDVTERKETECKLKARETALAQRNQELQFILDSIDFGILILDADLRLRVVNTQFKDYAALDETFIQTRPSFLEMLEYNRYNNHYAVSQDDWDVYVQSRLHEVIHGTQNAIMQAPEGKVLEYRIEKLPDGGRMLTYYDISALRKTQEQLSQEQKLLNDIMNAIPDWIVVKDLEHRFITVNDTFARDVNIAKKDLLGKNDLEIGFPEELVKGNPDTGYKGFWQDDDEVIAADISKTITGPHRLNNGLERILKTTKIPLKTEAGDPRGLLVYSHDVTAQKTAEHILKEREDFLMQHNQSLQLILDSIDFGVLIIDADFKLRLANRKFRQLFLFEDEFLDQGPSFTEMLEKNRYGKLYAIEPDKWPHYVQYRLYEVTQGNVQNAQIARADETVLKYNIQNLPDGGRMLTYYDITDLRKAEEKARQEQRLLRTIIDATPDWMVVKDLEHRFVMVNESFSKEINLPSEYLIGKTDLDIGKIAQPELNQHDQAVASMLEEDDEIIASGVPVFKTGTYWLNNGEERILSTAKIPLKNDMGKTEGLLVYCHDITTLKAVETALQQKTAYLEALHETALGLMNRLELSELLDKLAVRVKELSGAEDSFIYFVNEEKQVLELVHSAGRFPKNTVNPYISSGQGVAGTVWKTGQPLLISNYAEWQNRMGNPKISNLQVVAAFPITSADKLIGVLGIASDKTLDKLSKELMQLLPGFAQLASVAIDNARLHNRVKTDLLRTRALYKVGQTIHSADSVEALLNQIVESALEALSARWVILYKLDVDNQRVEQVAMTAYEAAPLVPLNFEQLQQGLTGWALKHQQAILSFKDTNDKREHPEVQCFKQERGVGSVVVVPLIYQGKPLGSLAALNRMDDPDFTEADQELLQAIAQQATLALAQHELNLQVQHQAFHDAVTDLPNRRLFEDRLELALAQAERYKTTLAILFIDLDGFKHVNDTLGHHAGDLLLVEVASRLKMRTRESDTLARMGGDEFALILNNLRYPEDAIRVAQSYLELFQKPFMVNHQKLFVGASVGVSVYPEDGKDPGSLLKHADSAMYQAKADGKNNVRCFTQELAEQAKERLEMEYALRHALENRELELYYQPQISLQSGMCIGIEALLRWKNPKYGFIPPDKFIPLAEESGLMLPIGEWVLQEACRQNASWQQAGYPTLRMGVNISALQFERHNFIDSVTDALESSGLEPQFLELEVTESVVMKNIDIVIVRLNELKRLGLSISIDDFGIGYSSLKYLQRLPLNSLKIDRSFIRMIGSDNPSLLVTIMQLARNFSLRTVAEGIESKAQLDFLLAAGCDEAQGFYFDKPLPANEFEQRWLLTQTDRKKPQAL